MIAELEVARMIWSVEKVGRNTIVAPRMILLMKNQFKYADARSGCSLFRPRCIVARLLRSLSLLVNYASKSRINENMPKITIDTTFFR